MPKKKKDIKIKDNSIKIPCINCNPKKYLTFNFAYIVDKEAYPSNDEDIVKLWKRMLWMSEDTYLNMVYKFGNDKSKWFEPLPINQIRKDIPSKFREDFPTETNEKYSVMRVYPSGTPNGTANPRIIGMIKHNIFYAFFLDWDGKLYSHGK